METETEITATEKAAEEAAEASMTERVAEASMKEVLEEKSGTEKLTRRLILPQPGMRICQLMHGPDM